MVQQNHPHEAVIVRVLSRAVSQITATSICTTACRQGSQPSRNASTPSNTAFLGAISRGLAVFCRDPLVRDECLQEIRHVLNSPPPREVLDTLTVVIKVEDDIVTARRTARTMAVKLGFNEADQSRIATAVSELARNIHRYAGDGTIQLFPLPSPGTGIRVIAKDNGPGIPDLSLILAGGYKSKTGLGLGILGCKRLADDFTIDTGPYRGTEIKITKYLRKA